MPTTTRDDLSDDALVAQLRGELRERGYVGLVVKGDSVALYASWFLGVLLGLIFASGRS